MKVPPEIPEIPKAWGEPNIVSFVRNSGKLLEWSEIYCFQKFLPLLTRWQIKCGGDNTLIEPDFIVKKRVLKGVPSLEVVWKDSKKSFEGLIPDTDLNTFLQEHPRGLQELYSTIEPIDLMEKKYPDLVAIYLLSIEKPLKPKRTKKQPTKTKKTKTALTDMSTLLLATEEIDLELKKKVSKAKKKAPLRNAVIDKFLIKNKENTPAKDSQNLFSRICSTPKNMDVPSDLEDDSEAFDISDIIKGIIKKTDNPKILSGKALNYDEINYSRDDLDLISFSKNLKRKSARSLINSMSSPRSPRTKRQSVDDSIVGTNASIISSSNLVTHVDKFIEKENLSLRRKKQDPTNMSFFFDNSNYEEPDEFEKSLDYKKYSYAEDAEEQCEVVFLSDDD